MAVGARMSAYVKDQKWTGGPAAFVVTTRANREFIKRFINLTASPRQAKIFQTVDEARRLARRAEGARHARYDRSRDRG